MTVKNTILPKLEIYVEKYNNNEKIDNNRIKHYNNIILNKQCNK